ncbi:hypothetical protein [Clostridium estertheticum]|uniref:RNA dependent RNA polymerase n=1 Tax=Clostridium estertheticum TaxID=238834 RepID=A0AA47EIU6_9CLOT|nr:hypothetical protein [Clostridium estertheticum]MBU3153483.1 hypothetical protein [Clostridium estertheticum]WAG60885.1 hypothetical protein LL038_01135 [Clostridium estertheticum]
MEKTNIYIKSVEGSEIYEHVYRDKTFRGKYVGMLPFSLKEIKLKKIGMDTFESKRFNKTMSNDIINVKFKQKVKSSGEIIKILKEKLIKDIDNVRLLENVEKLQIELDWTKTRDIKNKKTGEIIVKSIRTVLKEEGFEKNAINNILLLKRIEELKTKVDWSEVKIDDTEDKKGLRKKLYDDGFTIKKVVDKKDKEGKLIYDEITGEIQTEILEIDYVVFARSSSKSRVGQVLFIKKELHDTMIKHMHLGLDFEGCEDVDFPALLSYESLIGSALEDTVEIPVNKILIVSDVKSIFKIDCNVVAKNKSGLLESNLVEDYNMESDIFDGEGLLESSYFSGDREKKGFILARQHMFKSALYNCNVQSFLIDHCPKGQDYDTWEIKNTFNESILAKDVHCIITPASLKALKFSNKVGTKLKMWKHWKKIIKGEKSLFGICKSEKKSMRGYDDSGNILNQTSYQMLNSMPYTFLEMQQLSKFEVEYIEKLKNNNDVYVEFLAKEANEMNCNKMLVDLYKNQPEIVGIKLFKDKRRKDIHNYVTHIKKGKIRLNGDYATILQNGKELLYHAIGLLPVKDGILDLKAWKSEMILKGNEAYTTLHPFNFEYVCFRNPHTSPSNCLIIYNRDDVFISDYFNLSDNIIYTNAIGFPINRILSGQDVDSDNMIIFNGEKMLEVARKCYIKSETSNYKVCENGVGKTPNIYKVCNSDMAKIDNILAQSQKYIGTVVNLGQLFMSTYWDCINKGEKDINKIETLLKGVDICTILSEISIDMAKRIYDVDIKKQIINLKKCEYLNSIKTKVKKDKEILKKTVPLFFKYVSKSEKIEAKTIKYETSMDYLYEILEEIGDAEDITTIEIETLLADIDSKKVKNRQVEGVTKAINNMSKAIKYIDATMKGNEEHEKKERYNALDQARNEHLQIVKRYKIKAETVNIIIGKVFRDKIECKYKLDLLNTLYTINPIEFVNAFKL